MTGHSDLLLSAAALHPITRSHSPRSLSILLINLFRQPGPLVANQEVFTVLQASAEPKMTCWDHYYSIQIAIKATGRVSNTFYKHYRGAKVV